MIKVGVASGESKPADEKEKVCKEDVLGLWLESNCKMKVRKYDQTIDTKKSLKESVKDESKVSVDGKPKNDGSIVGIPEVKEVDKIIKVNTGGRTIDTSQ